MPSNELTPIESEFVDKLENEYKILQDKIDKIGAFRFTIKGWSITVILAAAFAGASTLKIPAWLWLISLLGFLTSFFWFELEQTKLRRKFGLRCISIESTITRVLRTVATRSDNKFLRSSFVKLRVVPGITRNLHKGFTEPELEEWSKWRIFLDADGPFYAGLFILIVLFAAWHLTADKQDMDNNDRSHGSVIIYAPKSELQPTQSTEVDRQTAVSASNNGHETKKKKSK